MLLPLTVDVHLLVLVYAKEVVLLVVRGVPVAVLVVVLVTVVVAVADVVVVLVVVVLLALITVQDLAMAAQEVAERLVLIAVQILAAVVVKADALLYTTNDLKTINIYINGI